MGSRKPILVTGAAGFIGFHMARRLLKEGCPVVSLDNLNDYYDVKLKQARLKELSHFAHFQFYPLDLQDFNGLKNLFEKFAFEEIIHLAAQAGVRYSTQHPEAYVRSNLVGFANILEACRLVPIKHLLYASSSSVYGLHPPSAHRLNDPTDRPVSLYGATKKSNEVLAHAYAYLYQIPMTGLRFFSIYGPWGRPDMAYFKFTQAILDGRPLPLFGEGQARRDYTFIDDCVEAMIRILKCPLPFRLVNIGNNCPVSTLELIAILEQLLDKKAEIQRLPPQPEDVPETHADLTALQEETGFVPHTDFKGGLVQFVKWYKDFYGIR